MTNPSTIKSKGDKIPSCETWENVKVAVMRNILLQKFTQNPVLKAKLLGTSGSPLIECTNNKFWGSGWFLDDPMWDSAESYPGKNTLGTLLEGIRDGFDEVILNSTEAICELQPMETGDCLAAKTPTYKVDKPVPAGVPATPATKDRPRIPPNLTKGKVSVAKAKKVTGAKPSAREISKSIVPTTLDDPQEGDGRDDVKKTSTHEASEAQAAVEKEGSIVSSEEILDPENYDAMLFTSSIFSDGNDSFDVRNVTLPSGRLDIDKLMGWSLPNVNLSRVLERSVGRSPGTRDKIVRLMEAQGNRSDPPHSTPALGNISIIRPRGKKAKSSSKDAPIDTGIMSVKESINRMLEEMNK